VRRLFTTEDAAAAGINRAALRWGERRGRWRRLDRKVYGDGPEDPTPLDQGRAAVLATDGIASGHLAGVLHRLDAVELRGSDVTVPPQGNGRRTGVRRRYLSPNRVVVIQGIPCTDGLQTMIDLATTLDDLKWEQALESALRTRLVSAADLEAQLPLLGDAHVPGTGRIRRVLALRPQGAAPTGSLLETLMVQLIRTVTGLPEPVRQYRVVDVHGQFVAFVDLCWPELGLFIELDGQQHLGQPVYDARRETAIVAATGWLCGRFTWSEVVRLPETTRRRLAALAEQARRRPVA
jgi:hypothetical protein